MISSARTYWSDTKAKRYKLTPLTDITALEAVYIAELVGLQVKFGDYNLECYHRWDLVKRHFTEIENG